MEIVRKNFVSFQSFLENILVEDDIDYLKSIFTQFNNGDYNLNGVSSLGNSVHNFFDEFEKINHKEKYCHFLRVSEDISQWIVLLLNSSSPTQIQSKYEKNKKIITYKKSHLLSNFTIDRIILKDCYDEGLLTERIFDRLFALISEFGEEDVTPLFLDYIPVYSCEFSWKFLYIINKYSSSYIKTCRPDLFALLSGCQTESEKKESIKAFVESIMDIQDDTPVERPISTNKQKFEDKFLNDKPSVNGRSVLTESNSQKEAQKNSRSQIKNSSSMKSNQALNNNGMDSLNLNDLYGSDYVTDFKQNNSSKRKSLENTNSKEHKIRALFNLSSDEDDAEINSDEDNENMDVLMNKLFGEKNLSHVLDLSNNTDGDLILRKYQEELAQEGIQGDNVLICSPTGSGKTFVALKIIEQHLKGSKKNVVAFIVPTAILVEQQGDYLMKYSKGCKVTKLTGGNKGVYCVKAGLNHYDIVVMTADVLKNALKHELSDSDISHITINQFSLLVFDECHHCDKSHPYNRIMDFYFYQKNKSTKNRRQPQIVGLTASTGTNKAKELSKALDNLFNLCANLDCSVVCTVRQNVEELKTVVPFAESKIISTPERSYDEFENQLQHLMMKIENHLNTACVKYGEKISVPKDRFHEMYLNFIADLNNQTNKIHNEELLKTFMVVIKYLEILYRAMIINYLFTYEHALNHIQKLNDRSVVSNDEVSIRKLVLDFTNNSSSISQSTNPTLDELVKQIEMQLSKDINSKIVVFVKEVSYTYILVKEFEKLQLKNVRPMSLVGQNKASDRGGMTKSSTDDTLSYFKQGTCNLIFATTVAEEGMDVAECNLVVRYGHVTNETSMVQCRGRARKAKSSYVVIVPDMMNWLIRKERANQFRETFMYKAIEKFQSFSVNEVKRKLNQIQTLRSEQSNQKPVKTNVRNDSNLEIYCKSCLTVLCRSCDIRQLNSNFIVINPEFLQLIQLPLDSRNPNGGPINCVKCLSLLGQKCKYSSYNVPNLNIQSILIQNGCYKKSYKKWSSVPFAPEKARCAEVVACRLDFL